MKLIKNKIIALLVLISIFTFVFQSCSLVFTVSSFESQKMKAYYSDRTNYIQAEGYIESYHYSQEKNVCYFTLQPDWTPQKEAADPNFKIINFDSIVLKDKRIEDFLEPGCFIQFSYAPKYFGDGYIRPIVSLTVDGENLLSFEDGYSDFMKTF